MIIKKYSKTIFLNSVAQCTNYSSLLVLPSVSRNDFLSVFQIVLTEPLDTQRMNGLFRKKLWGCAKGDVIGSLSNHDDDRTATGTSQICIFNNKQP